jgi:uncharacterized protein
MISNESKFVESCYMVVLQPTRFCNIDCAYCYLPNRASKQRMSYDVLSRILECLFHENLVADGTTFFWHASEPLVMPISYYEKAFDIVNRMNTRQKQIRHSFQTNGTLLSDSWCQFIQEQHIEIGVSIDGPELLHDARRKDRAGRGTYKYVIAGIELLRKYAIPFATISVVSDPSMETARLLFDFLSGLGAHSIGFNSEDRIGANTEGASGAVDAEMQYQRFFSELLRLQEASTTSVRIREFARLSEVLVKDVPPLFERINQPISTLSFDVDGNISTFSPQIMGVENARYNSGVFGNVRNGKILEILNSPAFKRASHDVKSGIEKCAQHCSYFTLCGGGVPATKVAELGTFDIGETSFCRASVKAPVNAIVERLDLILG